LKIVKKKDNIDKDFLNLIEICDQPIKKSENPLNLSKLLNIIDGIPERTGQIIIFCTNHPEKLDPALLRPGRVDCMIHFDKMNPENIMRMVNDYYKGDKYLVKNSEAIYKSLSCCNKFWTPAEIFQICSRTNNTKDIISSIKKCKKIEY
jgi:ATP-dependent 26S proteasome regulatory subunit